MSREHITVATFQKTQSPPDDLAELVAGTTCRGCTLYNQVCSGPSVTAQKRVRAVIRTYYADFASRGPFCLSLPRFFKVTFVDTTGKHA